MLFIIVYVLAILLSVIILIGYKNRLKNNKEPKSIKLENSGTPIESSTKYIKIICE